MFINEKMRRNPLSRQIAVDLSTPSPRKLRKTEDLTALDLSQVDQAKSAKSAKYTSKKKTDNNNINIMPIDVAVVQRKTLKARRYIKKDGNNDNPKTVQQHFDKIHKLFDKVADKYFDFQGENEDKENTAINNKILDSKKEHNAIINRKLTEESPEQTSNNIAIANEKNTMTEESLNLINNKKKRNTIHIVRPENGDNDNKQIKRLKSRRTINSLNETFSMDEDNNEEQPIKKRRTYELNITVTNIEDLKNLEQNRKSRSRSSSLVFEDVQLEEELKPSIDDCRESFTVPSQSLLKEISAIKTTDNPVLIDLCKSLIENVSNNQSKIELSKSISHAYFDEEEATLSTSYQPKCPINKRLNFSNITMDTNKGKSKLEDSVIVIDDSTLIEHEIRIDNHLPSTSKMSIFKTPYKKITELQEGFISSTPNTIRNSQKNGNLTNQSSCKTKSTIKSDSKPSRVNKMPDFASLHQKVFDGMEDIVEYGKRKKERAKLLLSGKKPSSVDTIIESERSKVLSGKKQSSIDSILDKPSTSKPMKNKRLVTFARGFEEKQQPANFIPLPTTPFPKFSKNVNIQHTPTPPPLTKKPTKTEVKFKQPTPGPGPSKEKPNSNMNPFSIKPKTPKPTVAVNGNLNRFGFKIVELPKATATRKEIIKTAIVNKSKFIINGAEQRRNVIKGVRSNRRFDLLMKMRNIEN